MVWSILAGGHQDVTSEYFAAVQADAWRFVMFPSHAVPAAPPERTPTRRVAPAFACAWSDQGVGAAWMRVHGEVDAATAPRLVAALREAQRDARLVVLDLRDVAFMDSAGVHAIVGASVAARAVGRRLILVRTPAAVHAVFALTGSTDDIDVFDVEDDPLPLPAPAVVAAAQQVVESRRSLAMG